MSTFRLVEQGMISGVISVVLVLTLSDVAWLPGLVYAVLVTLPWCRACGLNPVQTVAVFSLSIAGYFLAVVLVLHSGSILALFAGAIGAVVMLLPILRPVWDPLRRAAALTVLAGGFAGLAFWMFILFSDLFDNDIYMLLSISCVGLWQVVTAYTLSLALPVDNSLDSWIRRQSQTVDLSRFD